MPSEFIELLTKQDGRIDDPFVVGGALTIDLEKAKFKHLDLQNITFNGMVHLQNFAGSTFVMDDCNFCDGLDLTRITADHVCVINSPLDWFSMHRCVIKRMHLGGLEVERRIELLDSEISERLLYQDIEHAGELELCNRNVEKPTKIAFVITNDMVAATQFRFAGIPVIISTEMAKTFLESSSTAEKFATA